MSSRTRMVVVGGINLVLFIALIFLSVISRSVGVLSEAVDSLLDAVVIFIILGVIDFGERRRVREKVSSVDSIRLGYRVLIANLLWLLVLNLGVFVYAIIRLTGHLTQVRGIPVIIGSFMAVIFMALSLFIVGGDLEEDDLDLMEQMEAGERYDDSVSGGQGHKIGIKAIAADSISDGASALAVGLGGLIMLVSKGNYWLDPSLAIVVSCLVFFQISRMTIKNFYKLKSLNR